VDADRTFEMEVELLIQALYQQYHYDFRGYSRASLRRRVGQFLGRAGLPSVSALQDKVLHDRETFARLLSYLTVPTTELFRDPPYYRALRERVVPFLRTFPSLRLWIAGCSTGEEVYSIAILLKEEGLLPKALLYATDINPQSLERARRGIYDLETARLGSENYRAAGGRGTLSDHYRAAYESVQFDPALVAGAVFADHSLATDSVFAEFHLVSCRNVLIYFDRVLQDRAVGLFRDSLVRQGFLGLGSKESLQLLSHRADFADFAPEARIYQKR
jgi:chemotaxis protein methyltransferase CheR